MHTDRHPVQIATCPSLDAGTRALTSSTLCAGVQNAPSETFSLHMTSISTTPWQTCVMPSVPSNVCIYPGHVLAPVIHLYILVIGWAGGSPTLHVCMIDDSTGGHTVHINQWWYTSPRRVEIFIGRDAFQIALTNPFLDMNGTPAHFETDHSLLHGALCIRCIGTSCYKAYGKLLLYRFPVLINVTILYYIIRTYISYSQ